MSLLDKLERRFGVLGIPGLPRILVGFAALVFGLTWALPGASSATRTQSWRAPSSSPASRRILPRSKSAGTESGASVNAFSMSARAGSRRPSSR